MATVSEWLYSHCLFHISSGHVAQSLCLQGNTIEDRLDAFSIGIDFCGIAIVMVARGTVNSNANCWRCCDSDRCHYIQFIELHIKIVEPI